MLLRSDRPKRSSSHAAFVLGLGANGYGLVRSLAAQGVEVVGIYKTEREAGRFSKYCQIRYLDPEAETDEQICETLIKWRANFQLKPILFVSSDKNAALLARHREVLADHFIFHWVSWPVLERVVDKSKISRVCEEIGLAAPRTHRALPGEDLLEIVRGFRFPCIIKPIRSFDLTGPTHRTLVADSPEAIRQFYRDCPGLCGTTIVQEVVEGEDDDVYQCNLLVTRDGSVGAACCVRKLQQFRPGYGHMCFGRTEESAGLLSRSLRLLNVLHYRGLASLEFKRRQQDGEYYFIEMNPRLPWYNGLFLDAGVNLAHLAYLDLTSNAGITYAPVVQRNGVYWLRFAHSLRWLWLGRRKGRARFSSWLRMLVKARSFAWWDARDPIPCLREMAYRYAHYSRKLVKGVWLLVPRGPGGGY